MPNSMGSFQKARHDERVAKVLKFIATGEYTREQIEKGVNLEYICSTLGTLVHNKIITCKWVWTATTEKTKTGLRARRRVYRLAAR